MSPAARPAPLVAAKSAASSAPPAAAAGILDYMGFLSGLDKDPIRA